jgi:hypothetical protein
MMTSTSTGRHVPAPSAARDESNDKGKEMRGPYVNLFSIFLFHYFLLTQPNAMVETLLISECGSAISMASVQLAQLETMPTVV